MTAIVVMVIFNMGKAYCQQPDSVKSNKVGFIRALLKTDTSTARRVAEIQDSYKYALRQVVSNGSLTDQQRRSVIDSLMNEKNRKLEELLPEGQRNLIIPTTERKRTWKRDTTAKTNR